MDKIEYIEIPVSVEETNEMLGVRIPKNQFDCMSGNDINEYCEKAVFPQKIIYYDDGYLEWHSYFEEKRIDCDGFTNPPIIKRPVLITSNGVRVSNTRGKEK